MTERSYQECRIIMRHINRIRGSIANAEGNVGKWTKIHAVHEANGSIEQAEGAMKCLNKAMAYLKRKKEIFAAIVFPDSNMPALPGSNVDELDEFKQLHDNNSRRK